MLGGEHEAILPQTSTNGRGGEGGVIMHLVRRATNGWLIPFTFQEQIFIFRYSS